MPGPEVTGVGGGGGCEPAGSARAGAGSLGWSRAAQGQAAATHGTATASMSPGGEALVSDGATCDEIGGAFLALRVQSFESGRRRLADLFFLVINRAALEGDGGIRTADLTQRDRRGDSHVLR